MTASRRGWGDSAKIDWLMLVVLAGFVDIVESLRPRGWHKMVQVRQKPAGLYQ